MSSETATSIRESFTQHNRRVYAILVILALSLITVLPLAVTVFVSFWAEGIDLLSGFTVDNWRNAVLGYPHIIRNTIIFAVGSALLTVSAAVIIAWSIARTNVPFSRLYYLLVFGLIFLPPIVWERVWISLLGPNGLYTWLLPFDFNILSLYGMILVQGLFLMPLCLIILMPMFTNVNKSLEEASRISGGGILQTTRKITLPLLKPGILAALLLVLVISLGSLRVPLMIGLRGDIYLLQSKIYEDAVNFPIDYGAAFVDGTILILIAIPIFFLYKRTLGDTSQYETVGGEAFNQAPIQLGRLQRYALSAAIGIFLTFAAVIPVLTMVHASLTPYAVSVMQLFGIGSGTHPGFTFDAYRTLATDSTTHLAFRNSLFAAVAGTIGIIVVATAVSWIVNKSELEYRRTIDYISFLPLALTSVSLALGFMVIFLTIFPIGIYGTIWIIILAYMTRFLPGTIRVISPSVQQIQDELLESAKISGAGRITQVWTILVPLIITTVHAVGALRFAILFKELPVSLILQSAGTPLVAPRLFELSVQGNFPRLASIGVVVTVFLVIATYVIHRIGPHEGSKELF